MKAKTVQPFVNRVLIKREESCSVTESGIIIPETVRKKATKGTVIALGYEVRDMPMEVVVGDLVLFTQYAGTQIDVEDEGEYLIVRYEDIVAIEN